MKKRASGVLLHITSLPSAYGIGDFGSEAYRFVDFLEKSGQRYWQILPLNPTDVAMTNSPYSSCSAFAGNVLLISPEVLLKEGVILEKDLQAYPELPRDRVDYGQVSFYKKQLFLQAYDRQKENVFKEKSFKNFRAENFFWIENYSFFVALKEHFAGQPWTQWPQEIRRRTPEALRKYRIDLKEKIDQEIFFQYLFFKQWFALRAYCRKRKIQIIGDLPFYVEQDSADVWAQPENFKLDEQGYPLGLAGVPPDYFSDTGQLWGNPVYRWEVLAQKNYDWWKERFKQNFRCCDIVRVDHFRGFVDFWEVPKGEKTAVKGEWVKVPTRKFFDALIQHFKEFPIIAEDLGVITEDVKKIIRFYRFPGMKILVFAFDGKEENPYLPQNHVKHCLVYPGTHDNNTVKGWFNQETSESIRVNVAKALGEDPDPERIHWQILELAMKSIANTVIFSLQDALGLDEHHRMNLPSTTTGNWQWRFLPDQLTSQLSKNLLELTRSTGRLT